MPWPVFGIDDDGLIALANDVALQKFSARGAVPGASLEAVLPEATVCDNKLPVTLDDATYICRWRQIALDGSANGRLLLLEEVGK